MEDVKIIGGVRLASLTDKDVFVTYSELPQTYRLGFNLTELTYNYDGSSEDLISNSVDLNGVDNEVITNLYQVNASYPFDETRSP